ncbi:MAG: EmrB/QacA subfamily drug resistance transporter [Pontimonas sp.]
MPQAKQTRTEKAKEAASSGVMNHRQIMLVLAGLMSGMFLAALDQSIVGTAMRTIADDLDGLALQAWATTAYLITATISTPIYGKLGDIFGRRPLFMIAISIFVIGSVTSGFAQTMYELAAYRGLQGLGAGGLFSLALTIVADIVSPKERAKYQGYFLAVFGTSSVIGPLVGGLFAGIDSFLWIDGWRWVFLINLPIGIVSLIMVVTFLHVPHFPRPQKIDWWGAVTVIMGVVPLLIIAEQGRDWGWSSPIAIAYYTTSGIGIVAFIFVERAMGDAALIPLALFKNTTFALTQILGVIVGVGMFGGMIILPLVLQIAYGVTPTQSGLLMLPMVVGMATATTLSGRITSKTGKYRIFMNLGTAVLSAAYAYFFLILEATTPLWMVSGGMVIVGLGLGQLMQTLMVSSQNSVPARDIGVATSSATFFRQMGGTLGVAVFLSILFSRLEEAIFTAFGDAALQADLVAATQDPVVLANPANQVLLGSLRSGGAESALTSDSSFLIGADERLTAPFRVGFVEASLDVFFWAAVVLAIGFAISWFIKEIPLRDKSASQEAAEERLAAAS